MYIPSPFFFESDNVRDNRAAGDSKFVGADIMVIAIRGDLRGPCPSGFACIALLPGVFKCYLKALAHYFSSNIEDGEQCGKQR